MSAARWRDCLVALFLVSAAPGFAQTPIAVHGADSLFQTRAIRVVWAVLRGPSEDRTMVVIRVVNAAGEFRHLRLDGLDPFTKNRTLLAEARPLAERADLSVSRARFADYPSAEIHLFGSEEALRADRPGLVIFYLGIPDTTPEFSTPGDMGAYFEKMVGAAK